VTNYVISGITSLGSFAFKVLLLLRLDINSLMFLTDITVLITAAALTNPSLLAPSVSIKLTALTYAFYVS
jgi:hypothetical protein